MSNIYYIDVARLEFPWFGAIIEQKNDYKMEEQSWFFTQIYNIYANGSNLAKCVCFVNSPINLKTRFLAC